MKPIVFILLCFLFSKTGFSQQVIPLYEGDAPNSKKIEGIKDVVVEASFGKLMTVVAKPTLTLYLPAKEKATGAAVVICPGGGYGIIAAWHEGDSIAKKLSEAGVAGIVLRYRLPNPAYVNNKEIVPLQDAQQALIVVRENAKKWGINPQRVGILGSSAGGHLASTIGTHFQNKYALNPKGTNVRPDFLILNYPVISFADSLTHYGSRFNLAGPQLPAGELERISSDWMNSENEFRKITIAPDKIEEYSNELHVTKNAPPVFITHANDDNVVPVQNSILFIAALQKAGVEVKPFFYANGGHGYGLNNPTSDVQWFDACINWLRAERWLNKKAVKRK